MPDRTPYVSVLLPVRNGEAFIDAALDSLEAQTFPDWEAVVVDDGSTDGTYERLVVRAAACSRIRLCKTPPQGIVAALHVALKQAHPQAPYLARLDADDQALPERLERQTAFLDAHPSYGLVGSAVRFGGDVATAAGFARHVNWLNSLVDHDDLYAQRFRESPLAHPSVMFRRSLTERHGFYAEGPFPEDYELWLRWFEAGIRMHSLPEPLLIWNDPPQRLTRTHANYRDEAFTALRAEYLARHLARCNPHHPDVWIIGAGRMSRRRALPLLAHGIRIKALIDIDPRKIGNRVHGLSVLGREALPPPGQAFVLVFLGRHGAAEDAAAFLASRGYVESRDYLLAS